MSHTSPIRIVIFASGGGSNARTICDHFRGHSAIEVAGLITNNPSSGAFAIGKANDLPVCLISKSQIRDGQWLVKQLACWQTDLIALAGYIRLIPQELVEAFPDRIVNIHPSLLPRHGGKGMFGLNVHQSVIDQGDEESGITIHYVNEEYDEGAPILQQKLQVDPAWSASELQKAVLKLEHQWYPQVLEDICLTLQSQRS